MITDEPRTAVLPRRRPGVAVLRSRVAVPRNGGHKNGTGRAGFRADVEGLRAIAIALVLLYHAGVPGFPGGYVGVDVFYVVSGFLITGLLFDELRTNGRISLASFYGRRARRLLPSSAFVIAAVLLASWIIVEPLRFVDIARDGLASASYVANFRFFDHATDYFQAGQAPSPLLHFWSLAVEEQFYLVWPVLFWLSAGRGARRARVMGVLAAIFVGSLILSVLWTDSSQPRAFFLLPARAWELALGGALVLAAPQLQRIPRRVQIVLGIAGLAAIVVAGATFDDTTPFPGWRALVPVLGTGAVIVAGTSGLHGAGLALKQRPMQWIGKRSYVLYLWHWPLLVLGAAAIGRALDVGESLVLIGVAVALAALTHSFLEGPVHHSRWLALRPRRSVLLGLALTVVTVIVAVAALGAAPDLGGTAPPAARPAALTATRLTGILETAAATEGVPSNLKPPLEAAAFDITPSRVRGCLLDLYDRYPKPGCEFGDVHSRTTVVIFGDSHADQWVPAFLELAKRNQWRLVVMTKSSCPAAEFTVQNSAVGGEYETCDVWRRYALKAIASMKPSLVVISNSDVQTYWATKDGRDQEWDQGFASTLRTLSRVARETVVLGDTPKPSGDAPVCLSNNLESVTHCVNVPLFAVSTDFLSRQRTLVKRAGATFIDPSPWFCTEAACPVIVGDLLVYFDNSHMSSEYSRWLAPVLDQALRPVVERAGDRKAEK